MNATIAQLTTRSLLGRRRAVVLAVLPAVLLLVALIVRLTAGSDVTLSAGLLSGLAMTAVLPLLGLIAGTGAIGPEIEDGSLVYILSKPLARSSVAITKFVVAAVLVLAFGALPTLLAGLLMAGGAGNVALGYTVAAVAAGTAYSALFLLLAVLSRNAVTIGLIYALLWEGLVGTVVPGAKAVSIQQWSLALAQRTAGQEHVQSAVGFTTGLVCLVLLTLVCVGLAGWRLRSFTLAGDD